MTRRIRSLDYMSVLCWIKGRIKLHLCSIVSAYNVCFFLGFLDEICCICVSSVTQVLLHAQTNLSNMNMDLHNAVPVNMS